MECFDTMTHDINLCRDFGKKTKVLFLKYSFISLKHRSSWSSCLSSGHVEHSEI